MDMTLKLVIHIVVIILTSLNLIRAKGLSMDSFSLEAYKVLKES